MKDKKDILKEKYHFEDDEIKVLKLEDTEEIAKLEKAEQELLALDEVIGSAMDDNEDFLFDEDCGTLKAHRNAVKTHNAVHKEHREKAAMIAAGGKKPVEDAEEPVKDVITEQQELGLEIEEPKRKRSLFELLEGEDE